jgi:hypothetical protein
MEDASVVSMKPPNLIETVEARLFRHSFVLKTTFLRKTYVVEVFKGFPSLNETAEAASVVSINLLNQLPRTH